MYQLPKDVQYSLFEIDNVVEEEDTVIVEVEEHNMSNSEDSFAKHNIDEGKIMNNMLIIMNVKVGKLIKNINLNSRITKVISSYLIRYLLKFIYLLSKFQLLKILPKNKIIIKTKERS